MKRISESSATYTRSSEKPWVRRRRILLLSGVLLFCGMLLILVVARNRASSHAYEERIAALRAKGMPVSLEEIQTWQAQLFSDERPETPMPADEAEVQAVDLYQEAFTIMQQILQQHHAEVDLGDLLYQLSSEGALTPEEMHLLRAFLAENKEIIALLLKATHLPAGSYSLDYSKAASMELKHLSSTRSALRLLRAQAYLSAVDGNADGVFEALAAGISAMRPLQREPILISQVVHNSSIAILLEAMQDTLGQVTLREHQLTELQRMFTQGYRPETMVRALALERVAGLSLYEDPVRHLEAIGPRSDNLLHRSYNTLIRTYDAFGGYAHDREQFLNHVDTLEYALELPYPEARTITEEMRDNRYQSLFPSIAGTLSTVLESLPRHRAINETRYLQGATATAIERYQLDHGTPPPDLSALTPKYRLEAPEDPFDLQPLRYRREGNGYVLYSVGPNGEDNGGTWGEFYGEGDLVFHVGR